MRNVALMFLALNLALGLPFASGEGAPELIKDPDMTARGTSEWSPYGSATLSKITDGGVPALKVETLRRGSPKGQCGVRGAIGSVAAGDVAKLEITYRVVKGGPLALHLGPNANVALQGLLSDKDEALSVDVPAKVGGNWGFWFIQNMNARRGEILLKRFSTRIVEHGDPARFPIVTDGDMEQMSPVFYGAYGKARITKDAAVAKSGRQSLHVVSYEDDRPGSLYAGAGAAFGQFEAKTLLKVSFDLKVATGTITPILVRGAFDKTYEAVGPGDWKHVEINYEAPVNGWYSLIWTRTADVPVEFWVDNLTCTATKGQ